MERADVLPAGVGVVVVAEGEVDGAEQALLGRRAGGRFLAGAEGELADDVAPGTPAMTFFSLSASSPPVIS